MTDTTPQGLPLTSFVDVFQITDFDLDAEGFHRIKHPNMVFQKLREICTTEGLSYEWTVAEPKIHPHTGRLMVTGSLKVFVLAAPHECITVTGAATGQTPENEVAGVATSAFLNGCLRGLGMAEFVYAMDRQPTQQQQQAPAPAPQQQQRPTYQPPQQSNNGGGYSRPNGAFNGRPRPQAGGGQGYSRPQASRPAYNNSRPQVGGQGKWAGKFYDELPIEILQTWANFEQPNKKAVEELERRMGAGSGLPNTQYGADSNDPNLDEIPFN